MRRHIGAKRDKPFLTCTNTVTQCRCPGGSLDCPVRLCSRSRSSARLARSVLAWSAAACQRMAAFATVEFTPLPPPQPDASLIDCCAACSFASFCSADFRPASTDLASRWISLRWAVSRARKLARLSVDLSDVALDFSCMMDSWFGLRGEASVDGCAALGETAAQSEPENQPSKAHRVQRAGLPSARADTFSWEAHRFSDPRWDGGLPTCASGHGRHPWLAVLPDRTAPARFWRRRGPP